MRRSTVLSLPAQLVFPGSTDQVSDGVQRREEQGRQGADFVKLQVRVQRDVLVQRALLHLRDQVAAPGGQRHRLVSLCRFVSGVGI
jgi:hypothetical protein